MSRFSTLSRRILWGAPLKTATGLFFAITAFSQQVMFLPPLQSPTLAGPVAMATADFNGDGLADLAVSDTGAHVIAILLGNGDGTFQSSATYPVASGCIVGSLTVADFNADHKPDLLAVCQAGTQLFVYPGRGDGTFETPVETQLPVAAFTGTYLLEAVLGVVDAAVADFNGDNKLDLVLTLSSDFTRLDTGHLYFLPGNGDGTFGAATPIVP
jgi:hypothetical protein